MVQDRQQACEGRERSVQGSMGRHHQNSYPGAEEGPGNLLVGVALAEVLRPGHIQALDEVVAVGNIAAAQVRTNRQLLHEEDSEVEEDNSFLVVLLDDLTLPRSQGAALEGMGTLIPYVHSVPVARGYGALEAVRQCSRTQGIADLPAYLGRFGSHGLAPAHLGRHRRAVRDRST